MVLKIFKWTLIIIVVLFVLIVAAFFTLTTITKHEMDKKYQVNPEVVTIPLDSASIERGRQRASVMRTALTPEGRQSIIVSR